MGASEPTPRATATGVIAAATLGLAAAWVLRAALMPDLYHLIWILAVAGLAGIGALVWLVRAASLRSAALLRDRWSVLLLVLWGVVAAAVAMQLPMRVGFLYVKHPLERALQWELRVDGPVGPYTFAGGPLRDYCGTPGISVFPLLDAGDMAAFVHAPGGVGDLCFNEGAAGHLVGDWYWKVGD